MLVMVPEIVVPFFVTEVEMTVPIYVGMESTGGELLPGELVQRPPQTGGLENSESANPMNADGAAPPLRMF